MQKTPLNPLEEVLFKQWMKANGMVKRRENPDEIEPQADYRGMYKQLQGKVMPLNSMQHAMQEIAPDPEQQAEQQKAMQEQQKLVQQQQDRQMKLQQQEQDRAIKQQWRMEDRAIKQQQQAEDRAVKQSQQMQDRAVKQQQQKEDRELKVITQLTTPKGSNAKNTSSDR
jgi:hypothetical protein